MGRCFLIVQQNRQRNTRHNVGFTLMELLIVLSIIVVIASMAVPQMMSIIRESAVLEAADRVRETAGEARRFAIDAGIDYELRHEINGSAVVVLPTEQEISPSKAADSDPPPEQNRRLLLELPEEIQLSTSDDTEEAETLDSARFGNLTGVLLTQKSWSRPLIFRFDGTTQDFELRVSGNGGLTSKVTIRGLTGAARTSQVYQEDN